MVLRAVDKLRMVKTDFLCNCLKIIAPGLIFFTDLLPVKAIKQLKIVLSLLLGKLKAIKELYVCERGPSLDNRQEIPPFFEFLKSPDI